MRSSSPKRRGLPGARELSDGTGDGDVGCLVKGGAAGLTAFFHDDGDGGGGSFTTLADQGAAPLAGAA